MLNGDAGAWTRSGTIYEDTHIAVRAHTHTYTHTHIYTASTRSDLPQGAHI
jgi:hypothetical protein